MLRRICGGIGAIFMLHHVRPKRAAIGFAPNAGLEVTPDYLDSVIHLVVERGFDLVSLDEAVSRIRNGAPPERPFAVFTLDDGYRNNLVHAAPVFRRHRCPYTIFVAPAIADGTCELWWQALEAMIAAADRLELAIEGETMSLDTRGDAAKQLAWERLYWPVRNLEQHRQRSWIREACGRQGIDLAAMCRSEAMDWAELRQIAADPLCTIGAHTIHHYAVAQLPEAEARHELAHSAERIERELGRRPALLAYPYGDAGSAGERDFRLAGEAGFRAAVTTRKGMIFSGHKDHLMALPRVSLSGEFQKLRYADVLISGTAFAVWNRFRLMQVA